MIRVVDYDPAWPETFLEIKSVLQNALMEREVSFTSIEHVGSTSVPGLPAKPIIDVDIIVESKDVRAASDALIAIGFIPKGELGIKERWAFDEPDSFPRSNVYVIVEGSLALRNHLGLRNVLRSDSALRDEYAEIKRAVAAQTDDVDDYVVGKSKMIQRILTKAGLSDDELREIDSQQ